MPFMMKLLWQLFMAFVYVVAFAFFGHLLWMLGAALFRALLKAAGGDGDAARYCRRCGARCDAAGTCRICDSDPSRIPEWKLLTAETELESLLKQGKIDSATFATAAAALRAAIRERHQMESAPAVAPPVAGGARLRAEAPVAAEDEIVDAEIVAAELVEPTEPGVVHEAPTESAPPVVAAQSPPVPAVPVHPLDEPDELEAPVPARGGTVRPALGSMLQAFLDERNIRWGELAAGLLIVGSAVGLIISLRATLAALSEQIPYFPALLLMLGTAAFHAAGIYTLKYWRLRSTSRGVLTIGMLLVPLSFAAGLVLSGTGSSRVPITSVTYWIAVGVGVLGYGFIVVVSARALDPISWLPMSVGVLLPSVSQLFIDRFVHGLSEPPSERLMTVLLAAPMLGFAFANIVQLRQLVSRGRTSRLTVERTWLILGTSTFSLAVAVVWLVTAGGNPNIALARSTPMIVLAGSLIAILGLAAYQRTDRLGAAAQTTSLAVSFCGALLSVGSVIAAWPAPALLVADALLLGVACACLAVIGRIAWYSVGMVFGWTFAAVVLAHRYWETLPWPDASSEQLIQAILMGRSAAVITAAAAVWLLCAVVLQQRSRKEAARMFFAASSVVGMLAVAIAVYAGFVTRVDATWVTPVLFTQALLLTLGSARSSHAAWDAVCGIAWLVFWCHLVIERPDFHEWLANHQWIVPYPVPAALLGFALTSSFLAAVFVLVPGRRSESLTLPTMAGIATALAVVLATGTEIWEADGPSLVFIVRILFLAALALWFSFLASRRDEFFSTGELAALVGVGLAIAVVMREQLPGLNVRRWYLERRIWELGIAGIAAWNIGLSAIESIRLRIPWLHRHFRWPTDRPVGMAVIVWTAFAACVLSFEAAVSSVAPELWIDAAPLLVDSLDVTHAWLWSYSGLCLVATAVGGAIVAYWGGHREAATTMVVISTASIPLYLSSLDPWRNAATATLLGGLVLYAVLWNLRRLGRARLVFRPMAAAAASETRGTGAAGNLAYSIAVTAVFSVALWILQLLFMGKMPPLPELPYGIEGTYGVLVPVAALTLLAVGNAWICRLPLAAWLAAGVFGGHLFTALAVKFADVAAGAVGASAGAHFQSWQVLAAGLGYAIWIVTQQRRHDATPSTSAARVFYQLLTSLLIVVTTAMVINDAWIRFASPSRYSLELMGWPSVIGMGCWSAGMYWRLRKVGVGRVSPLAIGRFALATTAAVWLSEWLGSQGIVLAQVLPFAWTTVLIGLMGVAMWRMAGADSTSNSSEGGALRIAMAHAARREISLWCALIAGSLFVLLDHDADTTWWQSAAILPVLIVSLMLISLRFGLRRYGWITLVLGGWFGAAWYLGYRKELSTYDVFWLPMTGWLIVTAAWLVIELYHQLIRRRDWSPGLTITRAHWQGAMVATGFAGLIMFVALLRLESAWSSRFRAGPMLATGFGWASWVLLSGTWKYSVLDRHVRGALWGLLIAGAYGAVWLTETLSFTALQTRTDLNLTLFGLTAVYVALVAECCFWLEHRVPHWSHEIWKAVVEQWSEVRSSWVVTLSVAAAVLGLWELPVSIWDGDRTRRVLGALIPFAATYTWARLTTIRWNRQMQYGTILLASAGFVGLGWALMAPPTSSLDFVRYLAQLTIVLLALGVVYTVALPKVLGKRHSWILAIRRSGLLVIALSAVSMAVMLAAEFRLFQPGVGIPLDLGRVLILAAVIMATAAGLIMMAVQRELDPLGLNEVQRRGYVYAAELCVALAFAHIYMTRPDWFQYGLRPYWPYIVVLLAFAGVGLGEWLRRRKLDVLGEPFLRTGGFLPIVPAVGIWLDTTKADHALVFFFAGLVYVVIAGMRKSAWAAVTAALFGNFAYWVFLGDRDIAFYAVPQLWVIPPTLAVLLAAEINRSRLTTAQLSSVRYICVALVYLSSAGETMMKLMAPENQADIWRPLVLLSLSVAGIFGGFLLRVRAFLYLGTSFLLLSMVAMVWSSARLVQHTWPWWAFGISLGVLILIVFGLFEKYRDRALELARQLKEWQP